MTRKTWTTKEEHQWLKNLIPAFLEAQGKRTTYAFWPRIYEDFGNTFPRPSPTADEVKAAGGNEEAATREKKQMIQKRVFQWFHNNTRATSSAVAKKDVIPIKKSAKRLAPWQAYQKKYWNVLKPIVDELYDAHIKGLSENEKPKPKIQLQSEIVRQRYENESEAVKTSVEEYVQSLMNDGEGSDECNIPEQYQEGIDRVSKSLTTYMKTLEEATGWKICVFAGGPNPRLQGEITTLLYETTSEENDASFATNVGPAEWQGLVVKWNKFLHDVYPDKVRKERSLTPKSKSGTPTPSETAVENDRESEMPEDSSRSTTKTPICEYELQRARNIEQNEAMLKKLFGDRDDEGPKKGKKGKKAKSSGRNTLQAAAQRFNSNTLQAADVSTVTGPSAQDSASPQTTTPCEASHPVPSNAKDTSSNSTSPQTTTPCEASHPVPSNAKDTSSNATASAIPELPLDLHPATNASQAASITESSQGESADVSTSGASPGVPTASPASGHGLQESNAVLDMQVVPTQPETSAEPGETSGDKSDVFVNSSVSTTSETRNEATFKLSPTGYVTDEECFTKLFDMSNAKNWGMLINKWIEFENGIQNNGSLQTKGRPRELAWWMKNNRRLNRFPKIIKPADFIVSWRQWWLLLQPAWRKSNAAWPPSQDIPEDGHLSTVTQSGPNGFFLVILSLAWWGKLAADGLADLTEFETAMNDVLWVLSHIVSGISQTKRPRDEESVANDTRAKCARTS
ncbi:hypothetical protein F5887DRAFT_1074141 [Amanita rubescens]|nr:hypothetical protein F5887DRAFT_1074141 [Amanita rubescens]